MTYLLLTISRTKTSLCNSVNSSISFSLCCYAPLEIGSFVTHPFSSVSKVCQYLILGIIINSPLYFNWSPHKDSNPELCVRSASVYPLAYREITKPWSTASRFYPYWCRKWKNFLLASVCVCRQECSIPL